MFLEDFQNGPLNPDMNDANHIADKRQLPTFRTDKNPFSSVCTKKSSPAWMGTRRPCCTMHGNDEFTPLPQIQMQFPLKSTPCPPNTGAQPVFITCQDRGRAGCASLDNMNIRFDAYNRNLKYTGSFYDYR
jgi:hypothetical protein